MKVRLGIIVVQFSALAALALPAEDLALVFDEDRTEANRMYRGKETTVNGRVTGMRREGGSDYRVILDDAVAIILEKRDEAGAAAIATLLEAREAEEERVSEAREWAHDYKHRYQKYGGRYGGRDMKRYSDEINPEGSTEEQLDIEFHASGICKGVRGGHVLIDPVNQVSTSAISKAAKKVARGAAKPQNEAQAKALTKNSWVLKGKVYCENGQRYFAPTPDQFGVDFWSITLPARVGNFAVRPAVNGKSAILEADFQPAKRGTRGIAAQHVKLKSLKLE